MYALLCLWLMLATYFYWRGTHSTRWVWGIGFAIFAALAEYTQSLAVFYLVPLALWPLLVRDWRACSRVAMSAAGAFLLYLPWLVHIPAQLAKVDQAYWVPRPALYRLLTLALAFVTNLPMQGWLLGAGLFVALGIIAIAVRQTLVAGMRRADGSAGWWLLYMTFLPPVLMFVFSQWIPVYLERALLPSGAIFCIWIAWTLTRTGAPKLVQGTMALLVIVGFAFGLYVHLTYAGFPYAPYQSLMQTLQARQEPGDVIVHASKLSMLPTVYYDRQFRQAYLADPPGTPADTLAPSTQRVLGLPASPDLQAATGGSQRVWFILFNQSNLEYIQEGYPRDPNLTWLMEHDQLVETEDWGDIRVYLFSSGR